MTRIELNSGTSIPQIGFGTYNTADTAASVAEAIQAGYRHLDTAQMYRNEDGVGEGIRRSGVPRDDLFITTKLNNGNHRPADVVTSLDDSLKKLGLDAVDLFLIHWPVPTLYDGDFVSTWQTMIQLAEDGLIRSIGVSNFEPDHLDRLIEETGVVPAVNQIQVHPYFANDAVRAHCAEKGIVVQAWSPLGRGDALSDPLITEIAESRGVSAARVILRWHTQRGDVVIPKSDSPARMRDNADVFSFELTDSEMGAVASLDKGEAGRRGEHPEVFEG